MQIRSFGGAMGVQKSGHIEQWNNLREDTHKVSIYIYTHTLTLSQVYDFLLHIYVYNYKYTQRH